MFFFIINSISIVTGVVSYSSLILSTNNYTHLDILQVVCSQTLARRTRRPALGFAETADAAFSTGPRRLRPWARFARYVIVIRCSVFDTFLRNIYIYDVYRDRKPLI